jgi:hypothetical protein
MSENDIESNIALVLSDVADAKKALEDTKKALEVAKKTGDKDLILMNGNSLVAQQNILTELLKEKNLLLAIRGKFSSNLRFSRSITILRYSILRCHILLYFVSSRLLFCRL